MTLSEIQNGGVDDGTEPVEEIPEEALAVEEPSETLAVEKPPVTIVKTADLEVRHLALGASPTTLCGLDRAHLVTAHPSKAKRSDCLACRDAYRKKGIPPAPTAKFKVGDRIEYPDGSAWLVEDVRTGGVDVRCVLPAGDSKKGRTSTISADSPLRVFTTEEFEMAVERLKVKDEPPADGQVATPKEPKVARIPATPKWKPTKADVDKVRALRALGKSYMDIELEMEWPDGHGNRPWRIVKGAWDYEKLS